MAALPPGMDELSSDSGSQAQAAAAAAAAAMESGMEVLTSPLTSGKYVSEALWTDVQGLLLVMGFWRIFRRPFRKVFVAVQLWSFVIRQAFLFSCRRFPYGQPMEPEMQVKVEFWVVIVGHLSVAVCFACAASWVQVLLADPDLYAIQVAFHSAGVEIVKMFNRLLGKILHLSAWDGWKNEVCPICLDHFMQPAPRIRISRPSKRVNLSVLRPKPQRVRIFQTDCGHSFHETCMNEWVTQGRGVPRCPLCNQKIAVCEHTEWRWGSRARANGNEVLPAPPAQ